MSDSHINILRQVARQMQRTLDHDDAVDHTADSGSRPRRERLARAAKRARAHVAEAETRRQGRRPARPS